VRLNLERGCEFCDVGRGAGALFRGCCDDAEVAAEGALFDVCAVGKGAGALFRGCCDDAEVAAEGALFDDILVVL
jgi:hypothetical protein